MVKIFGRDFFVNSETEKLKSELEELKKNYTSTTTRPSILNPYMSTDSGAKLPIFPFPLMMIYELADNTDSLRIPIEALIREIFKNGFEVTEKYKYKCTNCGKEFQYKPTKEESMDSDSGKKAVNDSFTSGDKKPLSGEGDEDSEADQGNNEGGQSNDVTKEGLGGQKFRKIGEISPEDAKTLEQRQQQAGGSMTEESGLDEEQAGEIMCDDCGSTDLLRPEPTHRKILERLYKHEVNGNGQTLKDIAQQLERDLEIADNAYLLMLKSYDIDEDAKEIVGERVAEILRIPPAQVALIADSDGRIGYDDNGNQIFVCPRYEHRNKRLTSPFCDRCGIKALGAVLEVNSVYSAATPQPKRVVYGKGEIIWKAGKYKPDILYGFSPIYAIWSKVMALAYMDEYVRKYFDKMRPPRGMLVIASRNYETFKKAWDTLQAKAEEDPYEVYPVMVESDRGGKGMAEWVDFTGSLKELEFIEVRKEMRAIIGSMYGVLPLYYGEMPSGWNQEGLQVTITNRAVKWAQEILYESFFNRVAHALGVDDWDIKLKAGEETDKLREHQIKGVEIDNMQKLQAMGFEISRTHSGEFKVSKDPVNGAGSGNPDGSGRPNPEKSTAPKQEQSTSFQGEHLGGRPSDEGGVAQGHPASGSGTSMSKKSDDKKLVRDRY